ncbi:hypothetical protein [Streptomyces anulatus]|uniref:hypothetical protein n=1 Tax=Streptomyces anulatus TaxID=1892 RepID=UPI002E0E26E8|nr:hypothetical protein OG274_00020 [Streptomyces anulatus]WSR80684.1 hypothetical protein OG274_37975 [Streptomyces anulatus]
MGLGQRQQPGHHHGVDGRVQDLVGRQLPAGRQLLHEVGGLLRIASPVRGDLVARAHQVHQWPPAL